VIGRSLLLGAALLVTAFPLAPVAQERKEASGATPAASSRPPYLQRGDEVEARYRSYRQRLEHFFENFGAQIEIDAPDLHAKLRAARPVAVPYGYGILPKVVPDPPRTKRLRITSVSYSWRRTDGFIDRDLARLEKLETRLSHASPATEERRREWAKMVEEYETLGANQKLMASHIEYNRLWQGEVARLRSRYDAQTALHDAVLQRQALEDALTAGDQVLEPYLLAQVEALSRRIDAAVTKTAPPQFLRVEQPSPHHWILRAPVYTDIEDRSFVDAVQSALESAWHVRDGEDEFSVALDVRHVPPARLYAAGGLPARGAHIAMMQHIGRFPPGGAVLTTGANFTHVLSRSITVGPHDIAPNALAHEFGHILGFPDGYFRGYRDRGPDGFEVLEVEIDGDDIMSAPGNGRVGRRHFQQLLDTRRRP
jgi:hypothetical protein